MSHMYACVVCSRPYDPAKTRAELKGFCSMRCQHQLAHDCGWRKGCGKSEWAYMHEELQRRRMTRPGAEPVTLDRAS